MRNAYTVNRPDFMIWSPSNPSPYGEKIRGSDFGEVIDVSGTPKSISWPEVFKQARKQFESKPYNLRGV